jgi:hypothetical protein
MANSFSQWKFTLTQNVWRIILDAMLKCLQLLKQECIYSAFKCKNDIMSQLQL